MHLGLFSSTESRATGPRLRFLGAIWVALLLVGGALRVVLASSERLWSSPLSGTALLGRGAFVDALVGLVLLAPLGLLVSLGSGALLNRPRVRFAIVTALFTAAVFSAFVEFFFFAEFNARFNHIALDYLLFPGEVGGNIWESYPVPLYVLLALAAGALLAWLTERGQRATQFTPRPWAARLLASASCVVVGGSSIGALSLLPASGDGDRQVDEVAGNGSLQLVRAFNTASLSYEDYYRTLPQAQMASRTAKELRLPKPGQVERPFPAAVRRDQPLDVVVILGESFGSEFVGRLGGKHPSAPSLERWAKDGLLLTNLMATGNRTVRGLEGVLCSFVPLPGDSIWKRDKSEDVASIAGVLKQQGYRTEFVYGGAGTFDGMRPFALANGWDRFVEDGIVGHSDFPKDAYRTAWGVADEYILDALLQRQLQAKQDGKRFFGTALTVSNHKPFLTPDTQARGLRGAKLLGYLRWAGLGMLLSVVGWFLLRKRWRLERLCLALFLPWGVFLLVAWLGAQPRDSRQAAVSYSDRALGVYLDHARAAGLLDHTVVLFVGDHGARVYGAEDIPAASYRIPALFLAPESRFHGMTIDRLCSQVDLAPTLLSLAGLDYCAPFFGEDLLAQPKDGPGRAWLIHNRDIGLLTDTTLTVLGLRKSTTFYRRENRESSTFERLLVAKPDATLEETADRAAAVFQLASTLYEQRRYRLQDVE